MRHRRLTMGKTPIKHASALVANTGQGAGSYFTHQIYVTDVGARNVGGGVLTIKDSATTGNTINVGDIVKYVNCCIECGPRTTTDPLSDNIAWLEWALVFQNERDANPNVSNIGVATLGVICTNFYREDCLMTGCFPIGSQQSMSVDLKFKLPKKCVKIRLGYVLNLLCFVRTVDSTDTRTDSHRLMVSSMFKSYT